VALSVQIVAPTPRAITVKGLTTRPSSSAADQRIPDDTRVVSEELITEPRRRLANIGMDKGTQLTAHAMRGSRRISLTRQR
jgi:hypothetical protein